MHVILGFILRIYLKLKSSLGATVSGSFHSMRWSVQFRGVLNGTYRWLCDWSLKYSFLEIPTLRFAVKATNEKHVTSPRPLLWTVKSLTTVVAFVFRPDRIHVLVWFFFWTAFRPWLRSEMEDGLSTGDAKLDQAVRQWLLYDKVTLALAS